MTLIDRLSLLTAIDAVAFLALVACWFVVGWRIEHPGASRPSVTVIMMGYRREWMRQMVTRDPRIFDATILGSLRQGTSFFASACMIAIGGLLAAVSNTEALQMAAAELTSEMVPSLVWQLKLLVVVLFLTHAFLKFVWANRLFGYCSVVMAAVPNNIEHSATAARAAQAAELNIRAAWNFNRGLRGIYYALGTLAWLLGPFALLAATAGVTYIIWQREFSSLPRSILLEGPALSAAKETRT